MFKNVEVSQSNNTLKFISRTPFGNVSIYCVKLDDGVTINLFSPLFTKTVNIPKEEAEQFIRNIQEWITT